MKEIITSLKRKRVEEIYGNAKESDKFVIKVGGVEPMDIEESKFDPLGEENCCSHPQLSHIFEIYVGIHIFFIIPIRIAFQKLVKK